VPGGCRVGASCHRGALHAVLERTGTGPFHSGPRLQSRPTLSSQPLPAQTTQSSRAPGSPAIGRPQLLSGRSDSHPRFDAGFDGYSRHAGNKPRPSAEPSPRSALAKSPRQPVLPLLSCTTARRNARRHQEARASNRSAGVACVRAHFACARQYGGPDHLRKEPAWTQVRRLHDRVRGPPRAR
jgi:hypothetical protein